MARRAKKRPVKGPAAVALLLLALAGFLLHEFWPGLKGPQPGLEGELTVFVLDVGQGDSILLRYEDHWALVDGGTREGGRQALAELEKLGVTQLDYVFATHPHADHIGGLPAILKQIKTDKLVAPDAENPTATYEAMLDAALDAGVEGVIAAQGDRFTLGEAQITVLSPQAGAKEEELNNLSLILLVEGGGSRFLLCGDAEAKAERQVLDAGLDVRADVIKLGHHGSSSSSTEEWIAAVSPRYAIVSCGVGNSYGHPHQETLDTLARAGGTLLRTDTQGMITIRSREGELTVERGR